MLQVLKILVAHQCAAAYGLKISDLMGTECFSEAMREFDTRKRWWLFNIVNTLNAT